MATYPSNIPAFVTPGANLSSPAHSTQHTAVNAEVVAICATLGTNPQGTETTVKDRLETIEASIGTTGHAQNTDLGTTNATFYINGITGPYLKGVAGNLQLRNSADAVYVNLTLQDINVQGNITNGVSTVTVASLASAVLNDHTHANKATLDTYSQSEVNLADAVSKKHAQNTDTGTDSETFKLNNTNVLSPRIKVDDLTPTVCEIRNGADSDWAPLISLGFRGPLQANNADINKPAIQFNDTTDKWQVSNDGLSFVDIGTGLSMGGVPNSIQINGTTNLGGEAAFTYNPATDTETVVNINLSGNLTNGVQTVTVLQLSNTVTASHSIATAGTGISIGGGSGQVITNSAPDVTVSIASGTGISATGTYPAFTVTNTAPDQTVAFSGGTNVTIGGTYPNFTISDNSQVSGSYQAASSNLTSVAGLTYVSASFVKMTGANTFTLDTNTYLTSLSGAVLTDQTVGQTIGTTTNRLTKLWATDITCTNAIAADITGKSATTDALNTTTSPVNVAAAVAPSLGQVLMATDSTHATWQTLGGTMTRGTFTNATLTAGVLTITHSKALSAPYVTMVIIFDNNGKQILPDEVTGSTNSVAVDLTSFGTLTGTWGYGYIA